MTLVPPTWHGVDSHLLRVVRAVSELGSITAAAQQLGYSQPAISQLLARAEKRLGMPVVERVGRTVRLTEAGQILARHAGSVLTGLEAAAGELSELQGLRSGTVRLAAFPSASAALVPELLALMKAQHPGVSVTYLEAEPPEAVAAVRDNRADLAITFSYPGDRVDPHRDSAQGLGVTLLRHDEMNVVLPAAHRLADESAVDLAELSAESWIAGCPRCRGHLLELCARQDFTPRISYETDNVAAVLGLVEAGIGVAILPTLAIASAGVRPGVAVRPTVGHDQRTIHAVTAAGAERVPALGSTLASLVALTAS